MAGVRCREKKDHSLVWMEKRRERTRKYPRSFSKLEEDEQVKRRARLDIMTSNVREP